MIGDENNNSGSLQEKVATILPFGNIISLPFVSHKNVAVTLHPRQTHEKI